MSKRGTIEHLAKVCEVDLRAGVAVAEVVQASACAGCHAKSMCNASDEKRKQVEVLLNGFEVEEGDVVTIEGLESMGLTAVCLAYVMPVVLIVAVLIVCRVMGVSDMNAGVSALLLLAPYYFVLYLCRGMMKKNFIFKIIKK